jgi:hypothetical protein
MAEITDDQVVALLPALEEAARAQSRTVDRFVAPRNGIVEQASAGRHQFILGRRGVGKSTLLRVMEQRASQGDQAVAFVDLETLRGIPYPDVLIHLLARLLAALAGELQTVASQAKWRQRRAYRSVIRELHGLEAELRALLGEPQEVMRTVTRLKNAQRSASAGAKISGRLPRVPMEMSAGGETSRASQSTDATNAEFTQTKMDGLYAAADEIRAVLEQATKVLAGGGGMIILDDFYHVRTDDQPYVLAYLHQVVKNLDIYLKVGAVKHRLVSYIEGDPPTGLQLGHDAGELSLDLTLESFDAAQHFLERVLSGLTEPRGISLAELITDEGRTRLVLASGGVARDYLNLTSEALRLANEREARSNRAHNRITAEDVNEVSKRLQDLKQQDLERDSGPNADALRDRFSQLVRFCLDRNETNVFLVESTALREQEWGREIEALADLRLVHRIGTLSVQSSTYRGRSFTAFTLDLSSYTGTRSERIRQIKFWESEGRKQLRRVGLIFAPDDARPTSMPTKEAAVDWEQDPLPGLEADT